MREAGVDAAGQVLDALLEVGAKERGLVLLRLAVLDGGAAERVVELDRLVRRHALLVVRRAVPEPEVQVPVQRAAHLAAVGLEDDVGVALVELAVALGGPGHRRHRLDPPDLDARLRPRAAEVRVLRAAPAHRAREL